MPSVNSTPARREPPDPVELERHQAECGMRRKAIERIIVDARACKVDSDCISVDTPCPFGCERPLNRATDLDGLFAAIIERSRTCPPCFDHCKQDELDVVCDGGLCTFRAKGAKP